MKIRKTRPYRTDRPPAEPLRSQIIGGLIELRKAGACQAIWIDADRIAVRCMAYGTPERMTWREAAELTGYRLP